MRHALTAAVGLTAAITAPASDAYPQRYDRCADPRAHSPYCYGYLFVGDGHRRTAVVVDGVSVRRTPVLVLLDNQRRHTVRVGAQQWVFRVHPRAIVELELDRATARARDAADDAALARLRTRAPLGFASAIEVDRCGGIWMESDLRYVGPIDEFNAQRLWSRLPAEQVRRVVPRPEEITARAPRHEE